jgi:hypothetical protein
MLATLYPPARAQPPEGVRRNLHVSAIEVHGELPPTTASFDEARPPNAKTPTARPSRLVSRSCA